MANEVRALNNTGLAKFAQFLDALRSDRTLAPPSEILYDEEFTDSMGFKATVDVAPFGRPFRSAYELGQYLVGSALKDADRSVISHDHRMWNWLSLFFFDQICPAIDGRRDPAEAPAYFLSERYSHQRFYRHLVRSAWNLVAAHGEWSKVLLTPGSNHPIPVAVRAEPQMQIAGTQRYVESRTVVRLAYALYFDESKEKLKSGASSKEDGGPRRFVAVLNQFDLTYDLDDPPVDVLLKLLPSEFERFKPKPLKTAKQGSAA